MLGFQFRVSDGFLGVGVDLVNATFSIGLAQVGTLRHQLCEVGAVFGAELTVGQALGEDAGHGAACGVIADGSRTVVTEQAVDEVAVLIAVSIGCGRTGGLAHGTGSTADDVSPSLHTAADDAADRTDHQHSGDQRGDAPGEEAVGGVAEVDFVTVHVRPFHPQTTGNVAAHAGSNDLRHSQPDNRRNAQALGAHALSGPR